MSTLVTLRWCAAPALFVGLMLSACGDSGEDDGPDGSSGTVSQVSTNKERTCAVRSGALYCWGWNTRGELGTEVNVGSNKPNTTPLLATGLDSGVTAVSTGYSYTCAIKDGDVYCFGINVNGQLGHSTNFGNNSPNPTPTKVAGLSGITAIATGETHLRDPRRCALLLGRQQIRSARRGGLYRV